MEIGEKRIFKKHIKRLDPNEEIVKIDLDLQEIRYSDKIKQHRRIRELTKEEIVRAYVVTKLITQLDYQMNCIELEKEHTIGRRKKKTSARIDVLVKKPDETFETFMIIEVKAPDTYDREIEEIKTQLFNLAMLEKGTQFLVYYTAQVARNEINERVISVSYSIYDSYKKWEKEGRPNLMGIPKDYAIIKKPIFTKDGRPDLRKTVEKTELERVRKELHNFLWGGGRYQGNEIFNFVMKLFLAKIYDEKETESMKAYQFQIFYENGKSEKAEKTYERVNNLYKKALKRYLHFNSSDIADRDVRKIGEKKIDVKKVKYVVETFQDISLTENVHDVLGDFFERFLWGEFKQSKGQFFTHPNIVNFIIQALEMGDLSVKLINDESRLPYIIDPACGSGTFLIESMKTITSFIIENKPVLKRSRSVNEFISRSFPVSGRHAWAEKFIYGIDHNEDLSMATKVNMVMHGDGSVNIEAEDALSPFDVFQGEHLQNIIGDNYYEKPVNQQFDVIVSNPPFSIKFDQNIKDELPKQYIYAGKSSSENLFIERWYQLLRPKGRLGVVLPESVFDTQENRYIRLFLFKYFWIRGIISLPTLTFEPYTSTRTSILFAQKKEIDEISEYIDVWNRFSDELKTLKRETKGIIEETYPENDETDEYVKRELISKLEMLLTIELDDAEKSLSKNQIKQKYKKIIDKVDDDWWIFNKVSKELDYEIYQAIVENIGYKRTTRSERERDNELFRLDGDKKTIKIDPHDPQTVLEEMRGVIEWN